MIQVYTYSIRPPEGIDPQEAGETLTKVLDRMAARSEYLIQAEVTLDFAKDEHDVEHPWLFLKIWFQDRDRWLISKRIKFPVVTALRKSGMGLKNVRAVQVETPPDGRINRTPRKPPAPRWQPVEW